MIDAAAIKADLARVHQDFKEPDLFLANGSPIDGFLIRDVVVEGTNRASETHLTFKSAVALEVGDTITNRREEKTWEVIEATSQSGLYEYMLRLQ